MALLDFCRKTAREIQCFKNMGLYGLSELIGTVHPSVHRVRFTSASDTYFMFLSAPTHDFDVLTGMRKEAEPFQGGSVPELLPLP